MYVCINSQNACQARAQNALDSNKVYFLKLIKGMTYNFSRL